MDTLIFENISHLNLDHTLLCGQCFRWKKREVGSYDGVAFGRAVNVTMSGTTLAIHNALESDRNLWAEYFDLNSDYEKIKSFLSRDGVVKKCLAGRDIRILRQEPWETLISFIISPNNNIPRIKGIIERLCKLYGDEIATPFGIFYSFPSAQTLANLAVADLAGIRAGYRDKYILDAAKRVASGALNLDGLRGQPVRFVRSELLKVLGVGKKVADCVMLFSYGMTGVFPQDVWIKRILAEQYGVAGKDIDGFAAATFGEYGGLAQQYLFYYYGIEKNA